MEDYKDNHDTQAPIEPIKPLRPHKHRIAKVIFGTLLVLLLMWLSFGVGIYLAGKNEAFAGLAKKEVVFVGKLLGKYSEAKEGFLTQDIEFELFWDTWEALEEYYVDQEDITDKKLFYGALKGMVSAVGDPYTVFMDPKIAQDFNEDLQGTFEGIGAEIGMKNDILTIIAPLPDMPAEKAGLKAGDKVLFIDGESTMGISVDEAVSKIRGERGTDVVLTVTRDGLEKAEEITITRGKITVKSINTEVRDDGVFVVDISNFNEDTKNLFNEAIGEILENDPPGIILDLRNNPGGFLDTAIEVASEWVEDGPIVIERYGENEFGDPRQNEHLARGRARLSGYKTVVLVNQGSASASEIVAGALQDYDLAEVVGMQTFGKGSVQTLTTLDDGSSIKITVAKWLTPEGRSINDEGIAPDIEIDYTVENYNNGVDPQFDKAIELITGVTASSTLEVASSTEEMASSTEE